MQHGFWPATKLSTQFHRNIIIQCIFVVNKCIQQIFPFKSNWILLDMDIDGHTHTHVRIDSLHIQSKNIGLFNIFHYNLMLYFTVIHIMHKLIIITMKLGKNEIQKKCICI